MSLAFGTGANHNQAAHAKHTVCEACGFASQHLHALLLRDSSWSSARTRAATCEGKSPEMPCNRHRVASCNKGIATSNEGITTSSK